MTRATWPPIVRVHAVRHQGRCLGPEVGMPGACYGPLELDHIRASGGLGIKSPSTARNGALLCHEHHALKTRAGRTWRPVLAARVARLIADCAVCAGGTDDD